MNLTQKLALIKFIKLKNSIDRKILAGLCIAILCLLSASANAQIVETFGTGANQFSLNFVPIVNPGNANDTTGYGGVSYSYNMGVYDVSQTQLANAVASSGYNLGGGTWSGNQPATNLNWYQAAAFVNYLNTSQGYVAAYNLTFTGNTPTGINLQTGANVWTLGGNDYLRNANAKYFLPSENEFYKAAYYSPGGVYYNYATGSNSVPTAVTSGTAPGTAVYSDGTSVFPTQPADINQAGGLSPYGTMGQSGNVYQYNETDFFDPSNGSFQSPVVRGGFWNQASSFLSSSTRYTVDPTYTFDRIGLRVASFDGAVMTATPEPSSWLLGLIALGLLVYLRRRGIRAQASSINQSPTAQAETGYF